MSEKSGRCLCGGVQFSITGPLRPVVYCHCSLCRRSSGHFVAATACAVSSLRLQQSGSLQWYRSSGQAQRGFCSICGSNLFWRPESGTHISIMAGTLDDPSGLLGAAHIYVHSKGDYYTVQDGLPAHVDGAHGVAIP